MASSAAAAATKSVKLMVRNLPFQVGHQQLRQYFEEFGRVKHANVLFDKATGLSKKYGFVILDNKAFENVKQRPTHTLENHNIKIELAYSKNSEEFIE